MEKLRQDFPKSEKVRTKSEIDRIFRTGARFSCKGMVLRVKRNTLGWNRAVFVAVRSFEGAVQRNRAKRVAREVWRLNKHRISPGNDVAFVLYPEYDSFAECSGSMLLLLRKAGLIR
ncbi:MAG: ribonuclease P protein component [Rectinemataceae bacterium]|nr:ribonuclease P protein component [Rectinemataceae bacterium]